MALRVGLFVYPDFQLLDAAGPIAALEIAGRLAPAPYEVSILSARGGLVRSSSGVALATRPAHRANALDTMLVVGGPGIEAAIGTASALAFVRRQAQSSRRICSVCSGAFLLAASGLLDGRRATTHWRYAADLAKRFPRLDVDPDAIFVRDGNVWTSAGITAGIDLTLALVAEDHGEAVARQAAQQMVVYFRRPGGQSQFSALLELGGGSGRFTELLAWIRGRLRERFTVDLLAGRVAMSPRHFSRSFKAAVGMSPARAVERLRLEAARERVQHSAEPIELVAVATGFRDPERMRRAFVRAFGQPPQSMRRLARSGQFAHVPAGRPVQD